MKYPIVVTGGAGFIGSHLVDALIEDGYEVHIIDNLSTGRRDNVNPGAVLHTLDIAVDRGKITSLFKDIRPRYVFHLAAMARISECLDFPVKSFRVNAESTVWLLQLAREWGVRGFVFSSSSAVYGEVTQRLPIDEETPTKPISLYGAHKLAAEQQTLLFGRFFPMKTVALRYFNVYGTNRQSAEGAYPNVFSAFMKECLKEPMGKIKIYGDGEQVRDFIHVYDVVAANKFWIDREDGWGTYYNVGTEVPHSVNEVAEYFPAEREYHEARKGDPTFSSSTIYKFKQLGWEPKVSFEDGVSILFESYGKK